MANDTAFTVNLDTLDALIERMVQFTSSVESTAADVNSVVSSMPWTGKTAAAHSHWQELWSQGMEDSRTGLSQVKKCAELAHKNYAGAVKKNSEMWG